MKLMFRLTLDGMIRALRLRAHALADRLDDDAPPRSTEPAGAASRQRRGRSPRRREADNDSRRA
ncbi:MAG: hypothetical protein KF914_11905 [Rhizobiaceae bacterium]|nr:hypothetical protein [Rhizobiaceae bacterium]